MKVAAGTLALLVTHLLAAPTPARADGIYFTESFGGTKFDNELAQYDEDGAFRLRLSLGFRMKQVSVEMFAGGDMSEGNYDAAPQAQDPDTFTWGLDLKYNVPLSQHWEVYFRGSTSKMSINGSLLDGYSGRGLGVGTGVQVKARAPVLGMLYPPLLIVCLVSDVCKRGKMGPNGTAALFFDQGYDFYRLHDDAGSSRSVDVEATRWTFGFALGSDF